MNESNFKIEKHLEFKDKFKSKILNGKKTTTLRIYTNLKEGDLVYIHCGGNVIGIAEIESVMQKLLKDLNNEDAKLDGFKSKDELLEEEYEKFVSIYKPEPKYAPYIKNFLKAYITDSEIRDIIESKDYVRFHTNPKVTFEEFKALDGYREKVPEYVKDYVPINKFM